MFFSPDWRLGLSAKGGGGRGGKNWSGGEWYISHIPLSQGGGETDPHISMTRDSEREKKEGGGGDW